MSKWQKYPKRYCTVWESEPDLKDWIQPVLGHDSKAFCRFCKCQVRAHRNDLVKHAATEKHKRNAACYPNTADLDDSANVGGYTSEDISFYENEDKSASSDHDYSRMLTSTYNPNYHHILPALSLQTLARAWLQEDTPAFDFAGFVVGEGEEVALLLMKEAGVIAGRPFVDAVFKELGCSIKWCVQEGDYVEPIKTVATITGKVRHLLLGERVALNCITRCSGIATTARKLSKIASASGWKGSVAGTRKTTPGFRLVEKYALLVGGVSTHRHDLSSMIMLKDNHIWTAGSVTKAVKDARQVGGFSIKIEVECRSLDEAIEAADSGADIIMLDNFSPKSAQEAASRLKTHFPSLIIELSGGITESNLADFCLESIDVISLGMLTQGYSTIDFSFKIRKEGHDPKNPTVKTV